MSRSSSHAVNFRAPHLQLAKEPLCTIASRHGDPLRETTVEVHDPPVQDTEGTALLLGSDIAHLLRLGEAHPLDDMEVDQRLEIVIWIPIGHALTLGQGRDHDHSLLDRGLVHHHGGIKGTGVEAAHHRLEEGEGGVLAIRAFQAIVAGVAAEAEVDMDVGGASISIGVLKGIRLDCNDCKKPHSCVAMGSVDESV